MSQSIGAIERQEYLIFLGHYNPFPLLANGVLAAIKTPFKALLIRTWKPSEICDINQQSVFNHITTMAKSFPQARINPVCDRIRRYKTATLPIAADAAIAVKKLQEPQAIRKTTGKREDMNSYYTLMWYNSVLLERTLRSKPGFNFSSR